MSVQKYYDSVCRAASRAVGAAVTSEAAEAWQQIAAFTLSMNRIQQLRAKEEKVTMSFSPWSGGRVVRSAPLLTLINQ